MMGPMPPMQGGMPLPPQIASGPQPGAPIAGGPPQGMPMPPMEGGAPMGEELPPGIEEALMAQMGGGQAGPPPPPMESPDMQGDPAQSEAERYDIVEQEDGTVIIYENLPEGGRVARKIVPMGGKSATASASV